MSDYQTAGNTDSLKISEKCQKPSLVKTSPREKKTVTKLSAIRVVCSKEGPAESGSPVSSCAGKSLHFVPACYCAITINYCACYLSALSQPSRVRSSPKLEIEGMGWRGWQLQGGGEQQSKGGRTARQSAPFTGRAEGGQWTLRKQHPLGCSQGPWVGPRLSLLIASPLDHSSVLVML